ncbi:oxysterol-binding protein-related protein 8-like isoform X1 [Haliotis asinina]|uniref:oxysterol-binding protein-related protein 8-like isoform X1 n=2 Tax=Haliotis asinina TaxID=109174 RepID=UPI003532084F
MARSGSFGDSRDLDAAIQDIGMHHKSPSTGTMSLIGSGMAIGRDHHHTGHPEVPDGAELPAPSSATSTPSHPSPRVRASSESRLFTPITDKTAPTTSTPSSTTTKMSKRESLKVQKKNYRSQKKAAAKELLSTLKDRSVIVLADWLKVRGTLKSWTKLWCVLKPGYLVLYKSEKQKSSHWVGTVLLNTCRHIERPSKKDGFCFKLFHPLDQSIWATKGPKGETIGAFVQPLPYSYLIFRAPSEAAGKCWMDALELALRCTNLLMRSMTKDRDLQAADADVDADHDTMMATFENETDNLNESDCEKHFEGQGLDEDSKTDRDEANCDSESSQSDYENDKTFDESIRPLESQYVENISEELGLQGDTCQTEEVNDENKSLIWTLVKQVRPGMDLSKVVLPTFILEPRSFLDKLSDYYYHADLLSEAVLQEDPLTRMKAVVRWYLSGFYKKPKGLKKPYNPIIGETFRCYWHHPKTNSRTFYVAEQISHHPPVSAFFITNRRDGFNISGSILAKSKFYGNSLSAMLDGTAKLTFLKRGEDYFITMPYAHCKGILIGTLTMEMGGKVTLDCPKTGYKCELEFKLKPFLGSGEASNRITGKLKLGLDTLYTLEGHWDQEIYIKDKSTGEQELFWNPTPEIKSQRLKRYTLPIETQGEMESERLWKNVSDAVISNDMHRATEEKHFLEERQRKDARERKAKLQEWMPKFFERDLITADWIYRHIDMRPWDPSNDLVQYENDYIIQTHTRHRTPVVRTMSITSLEQKHENPLMLANIPRVQRSSMSRRRDESGSSTPDPEHRHESDSSECTNTGSSLHQSPSNGKVRMSEENISKLVEPLLQVQQDINKSLKTLQQQMFKVQQTQEAQAAIIARSTGREWVLLAIVLAVQVVLQWLFR